MTLKNDDDIFCLGRRVMMKWIKWWVRVQVMGKVGDYNKSEGRY